VARSRKTPPVTPDGRYFVVKGQLWRCTNPALAEDQRKALVGELMSARRAVRTANDTKDEMQLKAARSRVQVAKVALGERGPVWWKDGSPDFNRHKAIHTPYAQWYVSVSGDDATT
jgi:hypothetical protein